MLGFAMRAGKVIIGCDLVCSSMKKGTVCAVVYSAYASDATKKKIRHKSDFYNIPSIEVDIDTEHLGKQLGKTYAPAVIGITDRGFAEQIKKATVSE